MSGPVRTVRVRPLRKVTVEEYGVVPENATGGQMAEVWVAGILQAVVRIDGRRTVVTWGTQWAEPRERDLCRMASLSQELAAALPGGPSDE